MSPNKITTGLLLLLSLFWNQLILSAPQSINPLITYSCNTAADIIVITNSLLTPEEAKAFKFSDKKGTYNPWNLVKIDQSKQRTYALSDKTIIKKCTLSSGQYITTIEPKIFNHKLKGKCSTSISGVVTVEYEGFEIFEKRAFEDYCHGNAPIITRITVFGRTAETKIKRIPKYKFY